MNLTLINYLVSLIGLFGVIGSVFYFILVKIGLPKTSDGKMISQILTFFGVLVIYGIFKLSSTYIRPHVWAYVICLAVSVALPFVFSFVINWSAKRLNKISEKYNGYSHSETNPLLAFQKEKTQFKNKNRYIAIFDFEQNFIGSGLLDGISDEVDVKQQISTYGGSDEKLDMSKVIGLYENKEKTNIKYNKIIYDLNSRLKIFCINMDRD